MLQATTPLYAFKGTLKKGRNHSTFDFNKIFLGGDGESRVIFSTDDLSWKGGGTLPHNKLSQNQWESSL